MRLALLPASLLSAVLCSVPASAAPLDQFTVSGPVSNPYVISFAVNPALYSNSNGTFEYANISGSIDGSPDLFTASIFPFPAGNGESITLTDAGTLNQYLDFNPTAGTLFLTGDPASGAPPAVHLGSYGGINGSSCTASLQTPAVSLRSLPTLALFAVPTITTNCGDPVSLVVSLASTAGVTPEPSALALLGTGALGLFEVARRRLSRQGE